MSRPNDLETVKAMLVDAMNATERSGLKATRFIDYDDSNPKNAHEWIECANHESDDPFCFAADKLANTVIDHFAAQQSSNGFEMLFEQQEKIAELEGALRSAMSKAKASRYELTKAYETYMAVSKIKDDRLRELESQLAAAKAPATVYVVSFRRKHYDGTRTHVRDRVAFTDRHAAVAYAELIGRGGKHTKIGVSHVLVDPQPARDITNLSGGELLEAVGLGSQVDAPEPQPSDGNDAKIDATIATDPITGWTTVQTSDGFEWGYPARPDDGKGRA